MKKSVLVLVLFLVGFVGASVEVYDYSLNKSYLPFELIKGEINLTIDGEEFGSEVSSNDGGEMKLGDFLKGNGVILNCLPADCSDRYEVLDSGRNMSFAVPEIGVVYGGFVLNGENVEVNRISFDMESDFSESLNRPISIDFFEGSDWEFNEFSDEYSAENWGCYNPVASEVGSPIRTSSYCEMIMIRETGSLYVGAEVDDGDNVDLKMSVYPELGGGQLGSCLFNPTTERGCVISADLGESFSAGDYQVCVSAPDSLGVTGYRLFQEDDGVVCGFVYSMGPGTGSSDYSIFAKTAKYAGANYFSSDDFDFGSLLVAADSLIDKKYNRNCSEGCVLPFAISGVSQNVTISNIIIDYTSNGDKYTEEVGVLDISPATVDFKGVLDLSVLGFNISKGMKYKIFLDDVLLLEKDVNVLPAPIVSSVFPLNPPAGVPIKFQAVVQFEGNESLNYKWSFGDGETENTNVPFVVHIYDELGNYTMSVEVGLGELRTERFFEIDAISPESAVDVGLVSKRRYLDDIIDSIGEMPSWYGRALSGIIDVDFFNGELKKLEKARNDSVDAEDFVGIAEKLYALDVPVGLVSNSFSSPGLMTEEDDIDVDAVAEVGGAGSGDNEDYKNPILVWQSSHVVADVFAKEFSILKASGEKEVVFNVYDVGVMSSGSGESYFVIDKAKEDLFFRESVSAKDIGGSTVVVLKEGETKDIDFYYEGDDSVSFFVSPKLSSIVVEEDIDKSCNFNSVCEKGEDYKNCRSDCKPVGWAIFYGVLVLIFVLIFYGVLQIWYKKRYENYLFGDGKDLYNLVMYVTNARARGVNDLRSRSELRAKGWSSERVDYAIKKSKGERVGMFEIIPIGKIAAWIRNRRAKKKVVMERSGVQRGNVGRGVWG